ncbi:MAG: DUF5691 domain-containing protein [Pseudomonadota bacterium]
MPDEPVLEPTRLLSRESIDGLSQRWTIGASSGSTFSAPASPWREWLGETVSNADAELRLVALAGQAQRIAVRTAAPDLIFTPDLPPLAAPPLPDTGRPYFQRLLRRFRLDQNLVIQLLWRLEAEGFAANPLDWLPSPDADDLPEMYDPWIDWIAHATGVDAVPTLSASVWSSVAPPLLLKAFARLLRRDRAAAIALLQEHFADEPAQQRARLLETLGSIAAPGPLSSAETDFLTGLSKDRSEKVRDHAESLLQRRRRSNGADPRDSAADAQELADCFIARPRGWLDKRIRVTRRAEPTSEAKRRRLELARRVSLEDFAQALGIEPVTLIDGWQFEFDGAGDKALIDQVLQSTEPEACIALFRRLLEAMRLDPAVLVQLAQNAAPAQRGELMRDALENSQITLRSVAEISGGSARFTDVEAIWSTPALRAFCERIAASLGHSHSESGGGAFDAQRGALDYDCFALGLIVAPEVADATIDRLRDVGLHAADPRLDMLRLTVALTAQRDTSDHRDKDLS